jgi:hypothetical protein
MLSGLGELLKAQNGGDPEENKKKEFEKQAEMTSKIFSGFKRINDKPRTLTLDELSKMVKSTSK